VVVATNTLARGRGRPLSSPIRQNLIDLLFILGNATGYELSKAYQQYFKRCTQRVIYYHLRRGATMGFFSVDKIVVAQGSYSWGPTSEKIYYSVGPNATPVKRIELASLVAVDKSQSK